MTPELIFFKDIALTLWHYKATPWIRSPLFLYRKCGSSSVAYGTTFPFVDGKRAFIYFFSLFSWLATSVTPQISMSVKSPWMSVMAASAPTPRGRTSACVLTVSCHRRIWRPVWVMMHTEFKKRGKVCSCKPHSSTCARFCFSAQRLRKWKQNSVFCLFWSKKIFLLLLS